MAQQPADNLTVEIWRGGGDGRFETHQVPRRESQTVLDVVTHIQREIDPSLFYRFACRVGMCGSCAMNVNGAPRWTCRTLVSRVAKGGKLQIAPLANLPIIRDLACDMTAFFDKWQRAKGRFVPSDPKAQEFAPVSPTGPARRAVDAGIECIGCGVCYAACDVVAWQPDYLGPAALNRAWTLVNDERDGDRSGHLAAAAADAGCHACHSHQSCSTYCPKSLNPTAAIAGLKRGLFAAVLKGEL
ncbi:MAG: succinate dehydrogenase/fumarate reductase iron-sulfur subunit [Alphaproteobacteria bacterium]